MTTLNRRPKSGKVKAPRAHGGPDADAIPRLSLAIRQIHDHNASSLSFEEHYRFAYNLVLHKRGHTLYNTVAELVVAHLEKQTLRLVVPSFPPSENSATGGNSVTANIASAAAGQLFLNNLKEIWDDHKICMGKLRDVLKYMVRPFVLAFRIALR